MASNKKKKTEGPMTPEMVQMSNAKLFDFLKTQSFGSVEELNDFVNKNINGKRIDDIIPAKKGRKSDLEKSDDLIYQAYDSSKSKGEKLAKEALVYNPENIRALNYLADLEKDAEAASKLFKKAMEIGEKQLGELFFVEEKGHFWGMHETRPYMTAKLNYANCLKALLKIDESIKEYKELLELNPNDNQGVRYILSSTLLINKRYIEYLAFYKKFDDEVSTFWLFNYALYLFVTHGISAKANKALLAADKLNKHVVLFMTQQKKLGSKTLDYYSPGEESEASIYLLDNFQAWANYPESIGWICDFAERRNRLN